MKNETKTTEKQAVFFGFICMVFVAVLVLSNISASNVIHVNDFISLSGAEVFFPLSYIVCDLLSEFYGFKTTNKVITSGLILTIIIMLFLGLTTLLPSGYAEYNTVFGGISGGVLGITIASFVAYFCGGFMNNYVFSKLKKKDGNKNFFKRVSISSIIAEIIDSLVFITFCCIFASDFYSWDRLLPFVLTISSIKIAVEMLVFPLTNFLRNKAYQKNLVKQTINVNNNINQNTAESEKNLNVFNSTPNPENEKIKNVSKESSEAENQSSHTQTNEETTNNKKEEI